MSAKKGKFMGKTKKYTDEEKLEQRRQTYGCDGYCYGCNTHLDKNDSRRMDMCSCVDTCPETRTKEFIATIIATILYIIILLSPIFFMLYLFVN